jgi:hypothetical protein
VNISIISPRNLWGSVLFALAIVLVVAAFAIVPIPGGDDWGVFRGAAQRILNGNPLYGTKITIGYYFNAPWLAVLFAPLALLPSKWGWSILSVISIINIVLLCRRWNMGRVKLVMILFSPPMFYLYLHGNVDAFVLGGVLLPREFWPLVSITKPQTAIALAVGALHSNWRITLLITGSVLLLSFIIFGNWPLAIIQQPLGLMEGGHNLFRGRWPQQLIPGLILTYIGWKKQDEKFLIGASPFFSPYATTSSMLGPLMLVVSKMKNWQAVLLIFLYWLIAVMITR